MAVVTCFLYEFISVGSVNVATTPIIPKVISVSANVNAFFIKPPRKNNIPQKWIYNPFL